MKVRTAKLRAWLLAAPLALFGFSGQAAVISYNLAETSCGSDTASGSEYLATSFTTTTATTLSSVTLLLDQSDAGNATISIYNDDGLNEPGTAVGTLTSPASYSSTLANTTFSTSGITLAAASTYWVVLSSATGAFDWSFASDDTGTGAGFTDTLSQSDDAAANWFTLSGAGTDPYQLEVDSASAPEPTICAALAGVGFCLIGRRRRA